MSDSVQAAPRPSVVRRVAGSLLGVAATGLVAAGLDASWARSAQTEPASWGSLFVANAGVLVPMLVAVGVSVGLAALVLHPSRAPTLPQLMRTLRPTDTDARAVMVLLLPACITMAFVWVVATANLSLGALSLEDSVVCGSAGVAADKCSKGIGRVAGTDMGLTAAALAVALGVVSFGFARGLAPRLRSSIDPAYAGLGALVVVVALAAYGISTGDTSGGGGTLQVLGVLKRDELDLRAPGLLLLVAVGAYAAPGLTSRVPAWVAGAVLALLFVGCGYSATSGLEQRRVALGIERGAPLGKMALRPLRKLSDGDKDGASAYFGGGDCDDANRNIFPGAEDVPGNGIDEDCSGKDDEEVQLDAPAAEEPKNAQEWIREQIPEKPAVLFITVDTLRWDLGYTGYTKNPVSPNLDRLAKEGVIFDASYALASYTGKSVGPMLIGKHTSETHRGWAHFNKFSKTETFIQERLQKAGVRTISVQGHWYFFRKEYGMSRGFDVVDDSAAPRVFQAEGDRTINSDKLTDAAIAQLKDPENTRDSFYMWVHYLDPHAEYVRHEDFDFGRSARDRYDGEVAFTDHHVGRLIDHVRKSDFGKRTIIFVTSDHGEAFGEHGLYKHGFEVWEELVRVPMLAHFPGGKPVRVKPRRSIVDIVPTIADIFALPPPSGEGADFYSGTSLLADALSPPGHEPKEKIVLVDMTAGPHNADRQAFIENDMKLIATGGKPIGLYDLAKDPGEKKDLLDDPQKSEAVLPRFKAFRRKLRTVKVRRQ